MERGGRRQNKRRKLTIINRNNPHGGSPVWGHGQELRDNREAAGWEWARDGGEWGRSHLLCSSPWGAVYHKTQPSTEESHPQPVTSERKYSPWPDETVITAIYISTFKCKGSWGSVLCNSQGRDFRRRDCRSLFEKLLYMHV